MNDNNKPSPQRVFSMSGGEHDSHYRHRYEIMPGSWFKHGYYIYADLGYTYFKLHVGSVEADEEKPIIIEISHPI